MVIPKLEIEEIAKMTGCARNHPNKLEFFKAILDRVEKEQPDLHILLILLGTTEPEKSFGMAYMYFLISKTLEAQRIKGEDEEWLRKMKVSIEEDQKG